MELAIKRIKTGEVTKAVKNVKIGELPIKENDIIAIHNKNILNTYKNDLDAIIDLIKNMQDTDDEIISIYYSEGVAEDIISAIEEKLNALYSDFEIEIHHGGQPYYSYIVSME
jgi:dihydroxyacetone kinase-like predicted kinase